MFIAYTSENGRDFICIGCHFFCLTQQVIGSKIAVQIFGNGVNVEGRTRQADSLRTGGKDDDRRRIDAGNIHRPYRTIQQLQKMKKLDGNVNVAAERRNVNCQRSSVRTLVDRVFDFVHERANILLVNATRKADFYI